MAKQLTLLGAGHFRHLPCAGVILGPLNANGVEALELAVAVGNKLFGRDAVFSRIFAKVAGDLGVAVVDTEDARPCWPRVVGASACWRLRQQLEVGDRQSTMT